MVQCSFKRELSSLLCLAFFVGLHRADDSDCDWDIQDPELTQEIEKLSQRPEPYKHTPPGFFPYTEVTPPEVYYEAEYADKPCQDRAEGKILARAPVKRIPSKDSAPKVVVDHLKVEKVNGAFKVQQEFVPGDFNKDDADDKKLAENDEKNIPIGDNVKSNPDEQMKANEIVATENNENNEKQINLKDIEVGKNDPIGDHVKPETPKENDQASSNGIVAKDIEEQMNMKDVVNDVKEEVGENKNNPDQKLFAIVNDLRSGPNMKNLYNIAEETKDQGAHQKIVNNEKAKLESSVGEQIGKISGIQQNESGKESIGKSQLGNKNSVNDFQIKIKLESFDDAKSNLNNQVNNLVDLGRKSLSSLNSFQSLVNKIMPLAQNSLNIQNSMDKVNPQNFYMKYLQIDPTRNELKYEYYYFQKYVINRYKTDKGTATDSKAPSSLLLSKLLQQLLSPTSLLSNPLSLLSPLSFSNPESGRKLPIKIFMNEKSAAKYQRNLDNAEKRSQRLKRDAKDSTERPLFNEGPFKVEDPVHIEWAKTFLKQFPKEERPTSYRVIHQQPSSTDVLQWYHPFPGEEPTFYTIEPTVTRATNPDEPEDLCKCCHFKKSEPKEEDLVYRPDDKEKK